jgi:hypothetical protein
MDKESFAQSIMLIASMIALGQSSSEITAGFPGTLQGPAELCWFRCSNIFAEICERAVQSKTLPTGRQLIELPYKLAHSKVSKPPIVIEDLHLSETERERQVSISYS